MENIMKPKEKEVPSDKTRKIFGIFGNKRNFRNSVEASLTFPSGETTKSLLNYKGQADLTKDKAITQTRYLTRLL